MKKHLLLLFSILTFGLASAQLNQPMDINFCQNGVNAVSLAQQTAYILGALSPNDYTVTYYLSQADAEAQTNALPDPFWTEISQIIFVRVTENADQSYDILTFMINMMPVPVIGDFGYDVCDSDADGFAFVDLGSVAEHAWAISGLGPNDISISFHETMADAQMGANALPWNGYTNTTPFTQTIYIRAESNAMACFSVSTVTLYVNQCSNCWGASQMNASNVTLTSATLSWMEMGSATSWKLYVVPAGAPAPIDSSLGIITTSNPFVIGGLDCGVAYTFYIRSICSETESSAWVGPFNFQTMNCFGFEPVNLAACAENGLACFDLTVNNQNILGNLDPADFTITYYTTEADANNATSAITAATAYCIPVTMVSPMIYVRVQNNATSEYQISAFAITAQDVVAGTTQLMPLAQCDDDNDGWVVFDLAAGGAQLNTTNTLAYYVDSNDAIAETNPIANPTVYAVNAQSFSAVFIRESVANSCDIIHTLQLSASSNCNNATICAAANSLCNALGAPFLNSQNITAESGNDYNCLASQPNPTWFFIPVSTAGSINLTIEQNTSIDFNSNWLDVDYICYGPFANPVTPCSGMLTFNTVVGCSYSANAVENATIPNAVPGQYYILMVTNFSNQPGYIRINQTGGTAEIDCSGLRLNAFLDSNSNGVKDSGEQNFPLGQFNYERNNDSNVHNITSPTGIYNIYDINPSNSYNIGYSIDPAYAANYALTTSSYSNVSVVSGGGMQEYFFPVTVTQTYNDLAVSIIPINAPRPGFSYSNLVRYTNLGSQSMASGTVTFTKDPLVTIIGNTEVGAVNNATGFTYNFTNLLPFESREMMVTMMVPNIPTVTLGNLLTNTADIVPLVGDVAPENNTSTVAQEIIGSYDPNDKMEARGGQILITDFTNQDYLYYTIRFENTGTASAINVRIVDMLDSALDETTVKMVDASHDYILDRVDHNLVWKFENIELPTTAQNPEGGKGYVHFKVKPKAGYAVGDIIPNTASIFFDFNPAIVTNTFNTEFVALLGTPEVSTSTFAMYPNPAGDHVTVSLNGNSGTIAAVMIYDMLGKTIMSRKVSGTTSETVDVSGISSGMYFLEVTTGNNIKEVKKLILR